MITKITRLMVVVGALICLGGVAQAEMIDIQFNNDGFNSPLYDYTGAAIIGSGGDIWNHLGGGGTNESLLNTSGGATGVSLTWSSNGLSGSFPTGFDASPYKNLMQTSLFNVSGTQNISFTGLAASSLYDLIIYSQGDIAATGRIMSVTVNGGSTTTTAAADATASSFILGQNYLRLSVLSDASGTLSIDYVNTSDEANINGMQLNSAATPEPSTYLLFTIGLGALGFVKRRMILSGSRE